MEGHILPGDTFPGEDAAVLRGTFSHYRDQLQFPAHPEREDARELVGEHAAEVPIRAEGSAGNHSLPEIARLLGGVEPVWRRFENFGRKTRSGAVSVAARFEKRWRLAEGFSSEHPCGFSQRI